MYQEMKEVVRRCLLPCLIKNSVNEAALSPQIEQMNMRQRCCYSPHKTQGVSGVEGRCMCLCLCVRKVFCHFILHNECSFLSSSPPTPHTHTVAANHHTRELPLPAKLTFLPSPQYKSQCVCVCVCIIGRADSVVFLTGKQEVPSVVICILLVWGCVCTSSTIKRCHV